MSEKILWLDLETTGLDPYDDEILEVGLVVSDGIGPVIDTLSVVVRRPMHVLERMPDEVKEMHRVSALLDELDSSIAVPEAAAVARCTAFLDVYWKDDEQITVGGSGIDRFDLPFLDRLAWSPIRSRFHFRTIDTSGTKYLLKAAGVQLDTPTNVHRAVVDARWSNTIARTAVRLFSAGA